MKKLFQLELKVSMDDIYITLFILGLGIIILIGIFGTVWTLDFIETKNKQAKLNESFRKAKNGKI